MMLKIVPIMLLFVSGAALAESWLCIADKSSGFDYDVAAGEWKTTNFNAGQKYVVRRSKSPAYRWDVIEMGETDPRFSCHEDFDEGGDLECESFVHFRFNKNLLRFSQVATYAYFAQLDKIPKGTTPDSIYLMIGRCTAI